MSPLVPKNFSAVLELKVKHGIEDAEIPKPRGLQEIIKSQVSEKNDFTVLLT